MIITHDVEQGSDKWLELREGKYTGSNADKLLSHFKQIKIVNGVVSGYALAEIAGWGGNFYTDRGHLLEEEAIELYEQIRHETVSRPGFVTNSNFPECGYSPDGLTVGAVIEVKAFEEAKHMKMFNGDIPLKIRAQIYFGMLICGKKLAYLLIYNPMFAKKQLPDGRENLNYDPKKAFKIITVRANRNITRNLKLILKGGVPA